MKCVGFKFKHNSQDQTTSHNATLLIHSFWWQHTIATCGPHVAHMDFTALVVLYIHFKSTWGPHVAQKWHYLDHYSMPSIMAFKWRTTWIMLPLNCSHIKNAYRHVSPHVAHLWNVCWIEIATETTSPDVILHLRSIFARHGIIETVVSDNGPHHMSLRGFPEQKALYTSLAAHVRYPQKNGKADRTYCADR